MAMPGPWVLLMAICHRPALRLGSSALTAADPGEVPLEATTPPFAIALFAGVARSAGLEQAAAAAAATAIELISISLRMEQHLSHLASMAG
jgi:hypothetical protein